jgi:hypothetical protein
VRRESHAPFCEGPGGSSGLLSRVANRDHVLLHGGFSGIGLPVNRIVADIVRLENGKLAEHWDVIQDEVTKNIPQRPSHVRRQVSCMKAAGDPSRQDVVKEGLIHFACSFWLEWQHPSS